MRLGPSASQLVKDDGVLVDVVKSLSHLQAALDDPKTRAVLQALAPNLFAVSPDMDAAQRDLPSSSKPAGSCRSGTTSPAPSLPEPAPVAPASTHVQSVVDKIKADRTRAAKANKTSPGPGDNTDKTDEIDKHGKPDKIDKTGKVDNKTGKTVPSPDPSDPSDPARSDKADPGEPEINSSTHRAAHARLARRMERVDPASFPHMSRLWSGNRKDSSFEFDYMCFIFEFGTDHALVYPTQTWINCLDMFGQ